MPTRFYIDRQTDRRGQGAVRMSATICGARFQTSTGLKIQPEKWDTKRQRARQGASNADGVTYSFINATLARFADRMATYEGECLLSGHRPTKQDIARVFAEVATLRATSKARHKEEAAAADMQDVQKCFSLFMREEAEARQYSDGTRRRYGTLRNTLHDFSKSLKFADLDTRGLLSFVEYMKAGRGAQNSTIFSRIAALHSFLRWATERGYNKNTDFLKFKPRLKTVRNPVVFLEWEELMRLYSMETPKEGELTTLKDQHGRERTRNTTNDHYERARNLFCFCCFTSLRFSDAANLKKSDIDRGRGVLSITTKKTNTAITIELNKYALAILDKYNGYKDNMGFAFPYVCRVTMCEDIRDLCQLCGISQPITRTYYKGARRIDETRPKWAWIGTHTGRRTFICNALMLGIPPQIVMKWTGHSDYKAMRPYIDIADTAKAKAMAKFDEL